MKTIKSKFRVLTYLICFSFLAVTQISCENNNDFEEIIEQTDKVKKAEAKTAAKANIKRTRLKQRSNGLYRAIIVINNSKKEPAVPLGAVLMEIESGSEAKTYILDYFVTENKVDYYTFAEIKLDDKDIENQEVSVNITFLDAKKEVISKTSEVVVVEGLAKANIKTGRTRMKQRRNGLYKLTTEIEDPENVVAQVELITTDSKGNTTTANAKPKDNGMLLFLLNQDGEIAIQGKIYNNYIIKDIFEDVIGTYKEEITVSTGIIGNPVLTQNNDKKTFSLTIPLDRKQLGKDYKDLKIYVQLEATNSINYYEGTNFSFLEITKGSVIYENNNITFKDLKNIAKNEFTASITVNDYAGNELDKAKNRKVTFELK